jgi:hypothetical protein
MAWYDFPAWLSSTKNSVDGFRADRRRSARRPLGAGERLILLAGTVAALVFVANVAWRLLT